MHAHIVYAELFAKLGFLWCCRLVQVLTTRTQRWETGDLLCPATIGSQKGTLVATACCEPCPGVPGLATSGSFQGHCTDGRPCAHCFRHTLSYLIYCSCGPESRWRTAVALSLIGFIDPSPCPVQGMTSMLVHHCLHLAERSLYKHYAGMQSLRMMKTARPPWALLATCLLLVVRHTAASEAKAKASASAYASGGEASASSTAEALDGGTAYAATQAGASANKDKVTYGSPSAYKAEYGVRTFVCLFCRADHCTPHILHTAHP